MRVGAQLVLTFLLNASWQIALVAAFAAAAGWLLGHPLPIVIAVGDSPPSSRTCAAGAVERAKGQHEQLARVGLELVARRRSALEALQEEARALYPTLAGSGDVTLRYCSGLPADATEAE